MTNTKLERKDSWIESILLGIATVGMLGFLLHMEPITRGLNNYLCQQIYSRQGRIAEREFAEHKLRMIQYPNSPTGICDFRENPTSESCEYFFSIGELN